ncbi:MAG: TIM barrel protein [Luteitalea sp.]|nr:TIM barrel protein [Luteitalea sp.]
MLTTRRTFLTSGAAAALAAAGMRRSSPFSVHAAPSGAQFKVGVTDWNLRLAADPSSIELAKRLGFEGVQVSLATGKPREPIGNDVLQQYLAESRRHDLSLVSTCLNILHGNYLKSDPIGPQRVAEGIAMTEQLGLEVMLLPFFGPGALDTRAETDRVGDILRELGPDAEKANVILGLENTISARENVRIIERAKSPAVLVYYDVGNSTNNGFDIIEEIRWLQRDRICEIHLKDNPHFLGEGDIDFTAVIGALAEIGFDGWGVLETSSPTDDLEADMARNLSFVRETSAAT